MQPLPVYSAESLARLEPREPIGLIAGDEDRVPRNVIDECARRGEDMVLALERLCDEDRASTGEEEQEEFMFRVTIGNALLDFPRARHRALLEELAAKQTGRFKHFSVEDMASVFAKGEDKPAWARFDDPWKFYSPARIEHRQERWAEEDAAADAEDPDGEDLFPDEMEAPYVRAIPKVGRNDRCPCGSSKKYKHCCLAARTATAPELQNTDGDALSFHRILYDIDSPQAAFDALKGLALDATEDEFRGLALQLLEGRARYRSTVVESTKAMLERSRNKQRDPDEEARRARIVELNARPEVQALLAQQLAGHFATWPETSQPVLGGRTPLEAVRDADGREMVEALVVDIERHLTERFSGSHDAIVARLRERLGLARKS